MGEWVLINDSKGGSFEFRTTASKSFRNEHQSIDVADRSVAAFELVAAIIEANIGRRYERINDGHPPRKGRNQVSGSLVDSVTCLFIG
jgi:hypothetical protein